MTEYFYYSLTRGLYIFKMTKINKLYFLIFILLQQIVRCDRNSKVKDWARWKNIMMTKVDWFLIMSHIFLIKVICR